MTKKLMSIGALVLVLALLLTLAPACGNGDDGEPTPGFTPTPGVTPAPGVTPTPTPEAKTLKIGIVLPLSGPGAPWGIQTEQGAEWARDKINDAGGVKVGADNYMIKFVKCDDRYTGSVGASCASQMVHDEGIHFVIGSIGTNVAMAPILTEGKCFNMGIGNALDATVNPDNPYHLYSLQDNKTWVDTWWRQLAQERPDIETVGLIAPIPAQTGDIGANTREAIETYLPWAELVAESDFEGSPNDYYPYLTPLVAKNPDAIAIFASGVGAQALIVKQVRELGFEGVLCASNHGEPKPGCDIAGNKAYTGLYHNEPVYDSDLYPEATRALMREFQELYPGEPCGLCHYLGYSTVYFYKQLIEEGQSLDPDVLVQILDDPTWTYEWWGQPGRSLGGLETFGIRRVNQDETVLTGTDPNCEKIPISREVTVVP